MRSAGSAAQRISTGGDAGTRLTPVFWRDFSRGIDWYLITKNYCSVNDFFTRKSWYFSVIPCFLIIPTWGNSTDSPLIFLTAWSLSVRFARGIWSWRNDNCKFCLVGEIQSQAGRLCFNRCFNRLCPLCPKINRSGTASANPPGPPGHYRVYIYIFNIFQCPTPIFPQWKNHNSSMVNSACCARSTSGQCEPGTVAPTPSTSALDNYLEEGEWGYRVSMGYAGGIYIYTDR